MANLPVLFPILDQNVAAPLVRAAAEAPLDSTGCLTEYRPLRVRSIVGKATSRRGLTFSHSINPYRGCEFACRYCYARYTHEFLELRDPAEFERKIYFKQNAPWLVAQELEELKPGTEIALGTATDPYQPLERKQKITRSILEVFARTEDLRLGIVTKSTLILRDSDLLQEIAKRHALSIHITVTTMDTRLARLLEPRAPRPDLRIWTVARLRQAGLRAGVLCSPLMPGITDARSSISAVAGAAKAAKASFFGSGPLFLKSCSQETFFSFVEQHFPKLLPMYKQRYGENAFVSPEYRKRAADLIASVCREHGLSTLRFDELESGRNHPGQEARQPWLPFA